MSLDLESLGFTKEELQERVIERICRQVMTGVSMDEDGQEYETDSAFGRKLEASVKKQIDATINALAEKHVLPNVHTYVENLALQETTKWGEKIGQPLTFIQYLVSRAEAYLKEEVNYEGKPKGTDSYSWKGTQTRITHLVHKHLHYSIESAMKEAMTTANSAIVEGLEKTIKLKLEEFSKALKVAVSLK